MAATAASGDVPFLRLPDPYTQFRRRAERLRHLASRQHSLAEYLRFIAGVADAQQDAAREFAVAVAGDDLTGWAPDDSLPRLSVHRCVLPHDWRSALETVTDRCRKNGAEIANVIGALSQSPPEQVDGWAKAVLVGDYTQIDPGTAAIIGAALQVVWTAWCAHLGMAPPRTEHRSECPVCGSRPVVSVIAAGGAEHGLRYLCCGLCATQWNLPRIRCIHCGSTEGIAYYAVEGSNQAVKAEACGQCGTYSKILNLEKDPKLDPFADDLASLALDIMLADAGFERFGANPFLIPAA
jgi:FdhE protein